MLTLIAKPVTSVATMLRLHLTYWGLHRRPLSLARPLRFNELVQHRKLRLAAAWERGFAAAERSSAPVGLML